MVRTTEDWGWQQQQHLALPAQQAAQKKGGTPQSSVVGKVFKGLKAILAAAAIPSVGEVIDEERVRLPPKPRETEWERRRREKGKAPAVEEGDYAAFAPPAPPPKPTAGAALKAAAQRVMGTRDLGQIIDAVLDAGAGAPGLGPDTPRVAGAAQHGARVSAGSEVELGSLSGASSLSSSRHSSLHGGGAGSTTLHLHGSAGDSSSSGSNRLQASRLASWRRGGDDDLPGPSNWQQDEDQPGPSCWAQSGPARV